MNFVQTYCKFAIRFSLGSVVVLANACSGTIGAPTAGVGGTTSLPGVGGAGSTTGVGGTRSLPGVGGTTSTAGNGGTTSTAGNGGTTSRAGAGGTASTAGNGGTTSRAGAGGTASSAGNGGTTSSAGNGGTGGAGGTGGTSSSPGWLYTRGNQIYVAGNDATPWVGRGVNVDDIFFCGYDNTLWMQSPNNALNSIVAGLMSGWKPNFLRISLAMASYTSSTTWLSNSAYRTAMLDVIKQAGKYPNTYVLVTLRSDKSMIGQDQVHGDPEATGIPSDATNSPDKNAFPTGTDAVYKALVDDFADAPFVLFGITNEPGGNLQSDSTIWSAMAHAASVIRAEEDRLGARHHLISVQGNSWTSNIGFYAAKPIPQDNIVYEVHGYPPSSQSYTYSNIPVIIGEYGSLTGDGSAFYADLESKNISNLAWDIDPFSNCAPDMVNITYNATSLSPTSWGNVVQHYLLSRAH